MKHERFIILDDGDTYGSTTGCKIVVTDEVVDEIEDVDDLESRSVVKYDLNEVIDYFMEHNKEAK